MGGIVVNNEVKLAVAIIAECGVYAFEGNGAERGALAEQRRRSFRNKLDRASAKQRWLDLQNK